MNHFHRHVRPMQTAVRTLIALALLVLATNLLRAAEPKSSLELVPADADIYLSASRLGEHAAVIGKSNWWAKVKANEMLQLAWKQIIQDAVGPSAEENIAPLLADPENLALLALGSELASDEVFFYTDRRAADLVDLYVETANNVIPAYIGMGFLFSSGAFDFDGYERLMGDLFLGPVHENIDKIAVPHAVIGFKTKDSAKAERVLAGQIARLQKVLDDFAVAEPSNKISQEKVGGVKGWVWHFDGGTIPWPALFGAHGGEIPPAVESLIQRLQKLKGVVTLSVEHGYVLLSVGESADLLGRLGKAPLLADAPQLAPLKKLDAKRITGVSYVSEHAALALGFDHTDIKRAVAGTKRVMQTVNVEESLAKEIGRELDAIVDDLAKVIPKPGAKLGIALTCDEGVEMFAYDYGEPMYQDGTKPLSILDHVGDSPLAFWAGRTKGHEDAYAAFAKVVVRGYNLFDNHVLPVFAAIPNGGDIVEQVRQPMKKLIPIAKRFDRAVRDLWLPALEEGQSALVLDARVASNQWTAEMPPTPMELKLPAPALVFGAKDVDQLHAGVKEFRGVVNDSVDWFGETSHEDVSQFKLDDPKSREFPDGTIYWHPLPKSWGVDKRVAPNYGLGSNFAVFSFVPQHTQALLAKSSPMLPAPLDKRDRALAAATYIDIPKLSDAVVPWIAMVIGTSNVSYKYETIETPDGRVRAVRVPVAGPPVDPEERIKSVKRFVELANVLPNYTSATYLEKERLVTHAILRVKDVAKATDSE